MDFLPPDYEMITIRLVMAALLCGVIGFERESKQQPAGFRTHLLVGMSSALMMILSITGFDAFLTTKYEGFIQLDPARIPSYVISGIGFLGAGTIIVHRGSVRGLTTAASIWTAAGIGLVVGAGMYYAATLATVISLTTLYALGKVEQLYLSRKRLQKLTIIAESKTNTLSDITQVIQSHGLEIIDFAMDDVKTYDSRTLSKYSFSIRGGNLQQEIELVAALEGIEAVYKIKY